MRSYDVIVVGGGAAGLMCAITAGRRGRRVLVLEGSNKIGKKILMSGGGRCNFTNLNTRPSNFISENPHFCKSALSRFTPYDFLAMVEQHGIDYHEKTAGQLFCDHSSRDILQMLVRECDAASVDILTDCDIRAIDYEQSYSVKLANAGFEADSLIVASGGLSIPKMGASDFSYRLARQFGLRVLDTRAGLVPFTFTGATQELTTRVSGVSIACTLSCPAMEFTDDALFTHRGLSGPGALQLSSYWQTGENIEMNVFPGVDVEALLLAAKEAQSRALIRTVLSEHLPRALIIELQNLLWAEYEDTPIGEQPNDRLRMLARELQKWALRPSGTEGYRTAEVTLGGIDTRELSSRTMESNRQPGLYFIGEAVDVTGHLGGFNFQWAWSSAHAAGETA